MSKGSEAEKTVREIRRRTRRKFSSEEKIRIVIEGLRGEESIAALCRREGIAPNLYYRWSKDFLEAGKKRLAGDTQREANTSEVADLRRETARLKELLAETVLENHALKKSVGGLVSEDDDTWGAQPRRSSRSSAWSKARTCRFDKRWRCSGSNGRRFTSGTGATGNTVRKVSSPGHRVNVRVGTRSARPSSCNW